MEVVEEGASVGMAQERSKVDRVSRCYFPNPSALVHGPSAQEHETSISELEWLLSVFDSL